MPVGNPPPPRPRRPESLNLFNDFLRGQLREDLSQGRISAPGDVVIDIGDEVPARILENNPLLAGIKGDFRFVNDLFSGLGIGIEEVFDDFVSQYGFFNDFRDPFQMNAFVKNIVGFNNHNRAVGAETVTTGRGDQVVLPHSFFFQVLLKGLGQFLPAQGMAGGADTNPDPFLNGLVSGEDLLPKFFEPFNAG